MTAVLIILLIGVCAGVAANKKSVSNQDRKFTDES